MRLAPSLICLLLSVPALAQDPPIADTTAPRLYYPLAVGNVWEYESHNTTFGWYYERRVIPRDTTVNGTRYVVQEEYRSNSDYTAWELQRVSLLRFDTLSTQIVRWAGSQEVFETCPFGSDFDDVVDCHRYDEDNHRVIGSYIEAVEIGADTAPALAVKTFYPKGPVDVDVPVYVAPIGFHHVSFAFCGICRYELIYARLVLDDGPIVEYGSPAPVANEPPAGSPTTLTASVFPNPSSGLITLNLTAPLPQAVTVEVFDVMGRRVYAGAHAVSSASRIRLDGSRWAPGVYVVCATAGDGQTAFTRIVRR